MLKEDKVDNQLYQESDIDIFKILFFIWDNKYSAVTSGIIFFLVGLLVYLFIFPYTQVYNVKIKYKAPTSAFVAKLNDLPFSSELDEYSLTKDKILNEFRDEFYSYDIIISAVESKYKELIDDLENIEKKKFIKDQVYKYYLDDSFIRFSTIDYDQDLLLLENAISKIILKTGQNISQEIKNKFNNLIDKYDFEIRKLENEIANSIFEYDVDLEFKIIFLEEQLQLAERVGIEDNQTGVLLNDLKDDNKSINMYVSDSSLPYYLKGSKYIKEELRILKNRENYEFHINSLPRLKSEINLLKTEKKTLMSNVNLIIDQMPLQDLNLIRIDFDEVEYTVNSNKRQFIPLIFLICGIFANLIFLFIKSKYLEYQN